MTNLYWTPNDPPNVTDTFLDDLQSWVSENVAAAIAEAWETPSSWLETDGDRLVLTIAGPAKPAPDDPSGDNDIYTLKHDLIEDFKDLAEEWRNVPGAELIHAQIAIIQYALVRLNFELIKLDDSRP